MTIRDRFFKTAKYCVKTYGVYSSMEEDDEFFHCPECDEPLLLEDWDSGEIWAESIEDFEIEDAKPWDFCPVCGYCFY